MPAELLEDPAGISCVFSDGRRCRRTVAAEPGELVRDLLEGLASMVHPHGSIDAPSTLGNYTAAELAAGRHFAARPSSSPLVPYTPQEWERLHEICRQTADEAFARHGQALKSAARGHDPRKGGWTAGSQRWLLMRLGPMSDEQAGAYLGRSGTWVGRHGGMRTAGDELFPGAAR